jgi:F0F1-type ATP synthase membrane subunit b/b'
MLSHQLMTMIALSSEAFAGSGGMEIIPSLQPTLILTIPFLVVLIGMHVIFFGPLFRYLEEREQASLGATEQAKSLETQTDEALEGLETRILGARKAAGESRNAARSVALQEEATILSAARSAADQRVSAAVEEIHKAAEEASSTLQASVANLSTDISEQILGRTVSN